MQTPSLFLLLYGKFDEEKVNRLHLYLNPSKIINHLK